MVALLPVSVVGTGLGQSASRVNYKLHETLLAPFKEVVVNANVDLSLVEDPKHRIAYTEGQPNLVGDILFEVINETLYIRSAKDRNYHGKIQVTVPVNGLEKLEVNAASDVVTLNTLESPRLKVHFNGDVTARILSSGKLEMSVDEDYAIANFRQSGVRRNR